MPSLRRSFAQRIRYGKMQDWDLHRLRGLAGWLTGLLLCSGGGIGRRARLRIWWNNNPCGFESLPEHHMEALWAGLDSNQRRHKSQRIYSPPRLAASVPTQTEKLQDPQSTDVASSSNRPPSTSQTVQQPETKPCPSSLGTKDSR